jgi:hypothetical protein
LLPERRGIGEEGVRPPAGLAGRLVPAPSPSGSNNPERIKGKIAFFSLRNICLSGLTRALALLMTGETKVTYPLERNPAGKAEEAHRPPRGVVHLERKSILFTQTHSLRKELFLRFCPSLFNV